MTGTLLSYLLFLFLSFILKNKTKQHDLVAQAALELILLLSQPSNAGVTGIASLSTFRLDFFLRDFKELRRVSLSGVCLVLFLVDCS